jgi:hypothetical protein
MTTQFQCPLSGLVGCNKGTRAWLKTDVVSMPFKRAGWLQPDRTRVMPTTVSMPFKRAGWLQR